jgi:oxidoreductase family protein
MTHQGFSSHPQGGWAAHVDGTIVNPSEPAAPAPDPVDPKPVRPTEPDAADCCGEGCVRCVYDVYEDALERYRAALAAWQERHP